MPGALEALDDVLRRCDDGALAPGEAIAALLGAHIELRNARRLQTAMRSARLPAVKTLADFDFSFQPSVKREQIDSLHTLGFLERKENVVLLGPPGVGKTHLESPLGPADWPGTSVPPSIEGIRQWASWSASFRGVLFRPLQGSESRGGLRSPRATSTRAAGPLTRLGRPAPQRALPRARLGGGQPGGPVRVRRAGPADRAAGVLVAAAGGGGAGDALHLPGRAGGGGDRRGGGVQVEVHLGPRDRQSGWGCRTRPAPSSTWCRTSWAACGAWCGGTAPGS
ncbi:MAG: ATP-binding protein [Gemmatimonadetes bacterium]|nr:ATP-binding protein [Gemmatimonadota bacterium]